MTLSLRAPVELENLLPFDIKWRVHDKNTSLSSGEYLIKGGACPLHTVELSHLLLISIGPQDCRELLSFYKTEVRLILQISSRAIMRLSIPMILNFLLRIISLLRIAKIFLSPSVCIISESPAADPKIKADNTAHIQIQVELSESKSTLPSSSSTRLVYPLIYQLRLGWVVNVKLQVERISRMITRRPNLLLLVSRDSE